MLHFCKITPESIFNIFDYYMDNQTIKILVTLLTLVKEIGQIVSIHVFVKIDW